MLRSYMHGKTRFRLLAVILGVASLMSSEGYAMGKMVLFSEVNGKVLLDGKPVPGAAVEREAVWTWKKETLRDGTTANANGEFNLPAMTGSSFLGGLLPHEPVVRQTMTIKHGGRRYEAWLHVKHDYDTNGELDGKPIRMVCRLESAPQRRGRIYGICEVE